MERINQRTFRRDFVPLKHLVSLVNPLNCWQIVFLKPFKRFLFNLPREDCLGQDTKISYHDYCSAAKNRHPRKLRSRNFLAQTWPNSTLWSLSVLLDSQGAEKLLLRIRDHTEKCESSQCFVCKVSRLVEIRNYRWTYF